MKYESISGHTNFKHIIKNRRLALINESADNPFFHIKNNKGEYWTGPSILFSPNREKRWTYSYMTAFADAKANNGHVYLETEAGDLRLNEKDFQ